MGKRGSGASSTGPPKKKASRESIKDGDTAIPVPNDIKATFVVNPWLGKVLERFDAEWKQHQDIVVILEHFFPNEQEQLAWSNFLSETFPAESDVEYLSADEMEEACQVHLRPFMLSWKREAGNKGYVMQENFRNLIQLILAKGFETSSSIAGVEMPVISKHHAKLIQGAAMHMPIIEPDCAPANSISLIKGWSRACAMHLVLKLCCEVGILDQYMKYLGGKVNGFSTVYANFRPYREDEDIVDISRGTVRPSFLKLIAFIWNIFVWYSPLNPTEMCGARCEQKLCCHATTLQTSHWLQLWPEPKQIALSTCTRLSGKHCCTMATSPCRWRSFWRAWLASTWVLLRKLLRRTFFCSCVSVASLGFREIFGWRADIQQHAWNSSAGKHMSVLKSTVLKSTCQCWKAQCWKAHVSAGKHMSVLKSTCQCWRACQCWKAHPTAEKRMKCWRAHFF